MKMVAARVSPAWAEKAVIVVWKAFMGSAKEAVGRSKKSFSFSLNSSELFGKLYLLFILGAVSVPMPEQYQDPFVILKQDPVFVN